MNAAAKGPTLGRALLYVAIATLIGAIIAWLALPPTPVANPTLPARQFVVGEPPLQNVLTLEVADEPLEIQRGLMLRKTIGQHDGMAFVFDGKTPQGFWMHGTDLALDIVFVDASGRVEKVAQGKPRDDTDIRSTRPTSLVIEVPAGKAKLYGLKPGALVRPAPADSAR